MTGKLSITDLTPAGLSPDTISGLSLSGSRLAAISNADLVQVIDFNQNGTSTIVDTLRLSGLPQRLSLSPSGRYLIIAEDDGERVTVRDLLRTQTTMEFTVDANDSPLITSISSTRTQDILMISRKRTLLEGYDPQDGQLLFLVDFSRAGFVIDHLFPLAQDQDTFFVIGHLSSEMKDSLATFSYQSILKDSQEATQEVRRRRRINDYAYSLTVGLCGDNAAVIYRDPEDDELPDEDEEVSSLGELENFHGFYVRRIENGKLMEKITYNTQIKTASPLLATKSVVAVGLTDYFAIIPRSGFLFSPLQIQGKPFAFDPLNGRIVFVDAVGTLRLVSLP